MPETSENLPTSATLSEASSASGTAERLLEAAGQIFAEHGFANATIRDICALAGANVAAVNYHFGDKKALYEEVLRHTLAVARTQHPLAVDPDAPPRERLRQFVRSFMKRILDEGRPAWHGRLMLRELVEPTQALEIILSTTIRPTFDLLLRTVRDITGLEPQSAAARRCAISVIGQCVIYKHCEFAISQMLPAGARSPAEIDALADHIAEFSLGGLAACAAPGQGARG